MPDLKAVFFDVNDTLWDRNACACHVMEIVLPKYTPPLPEEEETAQIIRRYNAVFFELLRPGHLREGRSVSRRRRFEALLESYDVRKRGLAHEMSHTYDSVRRFAMRQFLRRDAHEVLTALGRGGLQRGAVMNGVPAVQRHLIQTLGLEAHLEHVVLGQIEGYSKPDVRLFRRALEMAGVEPDEAMHVGDGPLTDVLGAARAGLITVWLNTGRRRLPRRSPAPDFTITALVELLDLL